ncbi:hypothetical protein [Streptomyces sp. NBC_00576]|uniref:hypothetical protein n=1 Tax=Streptomyces sp. NBC_00576 TaxID=2903665 RepID=UPI002E7FCB48|nr:hypothetical protein [Streptomyces sp. NBC_00576]WUB75240.1 hypothetical protein OG734_37170 [Streptomyces sp. NBC_00576]
MSHEYTGQTPPSPPAPPTATGWTVTRVRLYGTASGNAEASVPTSTIMEGREFFARLLRATVGR